MKKVVMAALLFSALGSFAQETPAAPEKPKQERQKLTPEQRKEKRLAHLTTELNLTPAQQKEMSAILDEQEKRREATLEEMKANREKGEKPTQEEIAAKREKMKTEKAATEEKIKKVLDAQQFEKYKSLEKEVRRESFDKARTMRPRPGKEAKTAEPAK